MTGRPSTFTQQQADDICARLANGESLRSICAGDGFPSTVTVFKWLGQQPSFADQYARAREEQAEILADEIVAISDETEVTTKVDGDDVRLTLDSTAVARNRLRVDARKWVASKLKPKKYGDRIQHSNDPENPMGDWSPEKELRLRELMAKAGEG